MQISSLALSPVAGGYASTSSLLLPDLLKLTAASPQARALRELREEEERRRQTEPDAHQGAGAAWSERPVQVLRESERQSLPGSQAAKRQAQVGYEQKHAPQKEAFQRSLADATDRGNARGTERASPVAAESATHTGDEPPPAAKPASADTGAKAMAAPYEQATREGPRVERATIAAPRLGVNLSTWPSGQAAQEMPRSAVTVRAVEPVASAPSKSSPPTSTAPNRAIGGAAAPVATASDATGRATTEVRRGPGAATSEPGNSDANLERILRVVRSEIARDHTRATLRLDPPELGTIKLHLDLQKDVLTLHVDTQTAAAYRLLSEQLDSLRNGLEAAGIRLDQVEIRPPATVASPDLSDGFVQSEAQPDGHRDAGEAQTGPSSAQAAESPPGPLPEATVPESHMELATESLVNILA